MAAMIILGSGGNEKSSDDIYFVFDCFSFMCSFLGGLLIWPFLNKKLSQMQ